MTIIYPVNDKILDLSSVVEVYRNLNTNHPQIPQDLKIESAITGCAVYSIRQGGTVVAYANKLILDDVRIRIEAAGQKKVEESGRKNVHAYFVGYLAGHLTSMARMFKVNPYRPKNGDKSFTYKLKTTHQTRDLPFWYARTVEFTAPESGGYEIYVCDPSESPLSFTCRKAK